MTELKELSQPLVEWLIKNYNPNTMIVIRDGRVIVTKIEMSIPLPIDD